MNTTEIDRVLMADPYVGEIYGGTLASDELANGQRPVCYVVNTSPSSHPGTHWIAIYMGEQNETEYFCSFGSTPSKKIAACWEEETLKKVNNTYRHCTAICVDSTVYYTYYVVVGDMG